MNLPPLPLMSRQQRRARQRELDELALEIALLDTLALDSFKHFVVRMWPVIEPATPFVDGWHIDDVCAHLEAVYRFDIQKLLINMPPRHMKSILCAVMFPAWVWLHAPERRFIYCSYAEPLAIRDSVKTRMLIESDAYQDLLANASKRYNRPVWTLRTDSNQKKLFENTATGARLCVGVGGGLTGQGGDHLFVDDPVNAIDAYSDVALDTANQWHDVAFATRYNNPKRHTKVIIMQRLHENDLCGHVMAKEGRYETLILPARFNPEAEVKSKTSLNWRDPRVNKGELLWPERFTEKALDDLEQDLNRFGDSGDAQLQQDPKPSKGGLFPREYWQEFERTPSPILDTVQFWDCAEKPGITNDYTVCATWAKTQNGFYLLDLLREKMDQPTMEETAKLQFMRFKPSAVVIEDKSGGSSLIQYLVRFTTLPVLPYNPGRRDKELRATAAKPTVKAGKCFLPKSAPWVSDFKKEHEKFPKVKHDDQVDTTSMMVDFFVNREIGEPRIRQL